MAERVFDIVDGKFPEVELHTGDRVDFVVRTDTRIESTPKLNLVLRNMANGVKQGDPHFRWNNKYTKRLKPFGPDGELRFGFDVVDNPVFTTTLVIIVAIGATAGVVGYFAKGTFDRMIILAGETGTSFKVALGGIGIAIPLLAGAFLLSQVGKTKKAFS